MVSERNRLWYVLLVFLGSIVAHGQDRILVDGLVQEWMNYPDAHIDETGDSGFSTIDFATLKMAHDNEFFFLLLETGVELNLQDQNGITIYIDSDNDADTGFKINGIGAELEYAFGDRKGFVHDDGNSSTIRHDDIGLVTAPTVTSEIFEIAIRRDALIGGSEVIQVVISDEASNGDMLPSAEGGVSYNFTNGGSSPLPYFSLAVRPSSEIRVLSYNVLSDGLFDTSRLPAFSRILKTIQPDIIGFQEIYDHTSGDVSNVVENMLPSEAGQEWYHAKAGPDCHAISRYPILNSYKIPGYNSGAGNGAFLIDIPADDRDLLFIVAHPPCCGNNSGRQEEVDLIMEFVREAKNGGGPIPLELDAPILIVGDMNLVGDFRQLQTLLTGNIADESSYGPDFAPDWDGSNFLDIHPYVTGLPLSFTWYDEGSSFSPGKLDYIIYSGSNLELHNQFSLFTPGLPSDTLEAYGMIANDVVRASDHLPVVADFSIRNSTSLSDIWTESVISVFPNPTNATTSVSFITKHAGTSVIRLYNQQGRLVKKLELKGLQSGNHVVGVDTYDLASGLYFLEIHHAGSIFSTKISVQR